MQSPAPPSDFELIIDQLFGRDERPAGAPRPNRFSINSLEAAWGLAAASRKDRENSGAHVRTPYSDAGDGREDADMLLDRSRILIELGLDANFSEADIAALRREFALRNHPDRVRADLRDLATQRMMIANDLMDRYVAKLRKAPG